MTTYTLKVIDRNFKSIEGITQIRATNRNEADEMTFNKMVAGIDSIVKRFENEISYNYRVIKVEKI